MKQEEMVEEMATKTVATRVSPFRAHLCPNRLANRGPIRRLCLERGLHLGRPALP